MTFLAKRELYISYYEPKVGDDEQVSDEYRGRESEN